MSKFALIGHPLGHSMSPLIHEKLFALSGMTDAEYSLLDIDPADLPQAAVCGLQQAVLEEADVQGVCSCEKRLRQMARLRDVGCAL